MRGRVIDWNGGNGWVTVLWPNGAVTDLFAPTLYHRGRYEDGYVVLPDNPTPTPEDS